MHTVMSCMCCSMLLDWFFFFFFDVVSMLFLIKQSVNGSKITSNPSINIA